MHKLITSSEKSSLKKLSDEPTKNKYIDIPHIDMFEKEKNFLEIQNNIHHYNRHYFLEQEHKKLGESFTFEKYKNLREHT